MGKPGPKKIHRYSVEFKLTAVKLSHMPGVEGAEVLAADFLPGMVDYLKGKARHRAPAASKPLSWMVRPIEIRPV